MAEQLIVELDAQGRLVFPAQLARRLGITQGTIVVVEQETTDATYLRVEHPTTTIVNKDGVLVVRTTDPLSMADAIDHEREQHMIELWERSDAHLT